MVLNPPEDFSEGLLALDVKRVSELDVVDLVLGYCVSWTLSAAVCLIVSSPLLHSRSRSRPD